MSVRTRSSSAGGMPPSSASRTMSKAAASTASGAWPGRGVSIRLSVPAICRASCQATASWAICRS